MDVVIWAFLEEFNERLTHVVAGAIPTNFWTAARHVPINYKFFAPAADLESQIFVASLQILEDFRITADVLAPRAFHLMKLWAQSREMQKQTANAAGDERFFAARPEVAHDAAGDGEGSENEEVEFGDVEHGDGDKATPPRPQGRRSATPVILEGPSTRAGLLGRDEPEGVKERRHSWRRPHPLRSSPFFGPGE